MNYKVVGPPGTGKTDTLLNTVKEYVDKGTPLNQIPKQQLKNDQIYLIE